MTSSKEGRLKEALDHIVNTMIPQLSEYLIGERDEARTEVKRLHGLLSTARLESSLANYMIHMHQTAVCPEFDSHKGCPSEICSIEDMTLWKSVEESHCVSLIRIKDQYNPWCPTCKPPEVGSIVHLIGINHAGKWYQPDGPIVWGPDFASPATDMWDYWMPFVAPKIK